MTVGWSALLAYTGSTLYKTTKAFSYWSPEKESKERTTNPRKEWDYVVKGQVRVGLCGEGTGGHSSESRSKFIKLHV
jgi:hypothetical protein